MKKILAVIIGMLICGSAYANWDSGTDMQPLTVSAGFTQIQNSLKAIDGTSGTQPAKISVGATGVEFEGSSADANETVITATNPTVDRTQTLQDNSGIIPLGTVGNTLFLTTTAATNVTLPTSGTLLTSAMQYTDSRYKMVSATRDLTTAPGTQAITGAGFAPKGVIIIGGVDSAQPNAWGVAESGGTSFSLGISSDDKTGPYSGNVITTISGVYIANYQQASVTTWGADGITLTWTKGGSPTGTLTFACYFLR